MNRSSNRSGRLLYRPNEMVITRCKGKFRVNRFHFESKNQTRTEFDPAALTELFLDHLFVDLYFIDYKLIPFL